MNCYNQQPSSLHTTFFSSNSFNSLVPEGFDYSLKWVNFKLISTINILSIFCEIAIRWMPLHLTDHYSTLVRVMAWCRQATSHYLSQCWLRSLSPYDVTRPQWVNLLAPGSSNFKCFVFKCISEINVDRSHWQLVNIGSGNGLVPEGTKPLFELMLTRYIVCYWIWVNTCINFQTPT